MKKNTGDKFRQRIAFNLAKKCLLGDKHNPSEPQEDLFMLEFSYTDFAKENGKASLDTRTYKNGWLGKSKSHLRVQDLLDKIVNKFGNSQLSEWSERQEQSKYLHERSLYKALGDITHHQGWHQYAIKNSPEIFQNQAEYAVERAKKTYEDMKSSGDYKDGINLSYIAGVDTEPSRWVNRSAINDVLHEHLNALDVMCMDYSATNIDVCNKLLSRIHGRWNPHGANCFFEFMDFSHSDFMCRDEGDYARKVEEFKRSNYTDGLRRTIVEKFIIPDNIYQTYDVFSPARISEFLTSIPISKDISEHPLLEFWILEFASSVAGFYWLVDAYRRRDGYAVIPQQSMKTLDAVSGGYDLLWGSSDIQQCLCQLGIYTRSEFYDDYHAIFSKVRVEYRSILKRFGIDVAELQDILKEFHSKNAIVFSPGKLRI